MEDNKDIQHFLSQSVAMNSCDEIADICQAFFKQTGLHYYNYVRIYHNGSRISLTNNEPWSRYVFTQHSQHQFLFEERLPERGCSRYVIWDNDKTHQNDSLLQVARETYNIDHGLTITTAYEGYIELQYFGTSRENDTINHFYLNNLDFINSFGAFFREKAAHIIQAAEQEKAFLKGHRPFWLDANDKLDQFKRNQYFEELSNHQVERYHLSGKYKHIYLTIREAQCLTALIDGLTAKESARLLKISHRTVQIHIENVKQKLNCHRRSELVNSAQQSGFRAIYTVIHALYFRHCSEIFEAREQAYS